METGLLGHLQTPNSMHRLDAILPFGRIDSFMFFNISEDDSEASNSYCTYSIRDPSAGIWHVSNLLSMLVDITMETASSHDATPAFQDYLAWLLESFLVSHHLQKRFEVNPDLYEICKKSRVLSFCTLHALLASLRSHMTDPMLKKGYALLSILCADLLETPAYLSEESITVTICSSILNLAVICKSHYSLRRVISLHLMPSIKSALLDEAVRTKLGTDFQVRFH